jgi:hypothetical protein
MQKSSALDITTSPASVVSNSDNGKVVKVLTLFVTNNSASAVGVDAEILRFGDTFKLLKGASIPAGRSVSFFIDKDFGVFLENGDELRLSADATGTEAVCSYEVIDDASDTRPAPTDV